MSTRKRVNKVFVVYSCTKTPAEIGISVALHVLRNYNIHSIFIIIHGYIVTDMGVDFHFRLHIYIRIDRLIIYFTYYIFIYFGVSVRSCRINVTWRQNFNTNQVFSVKCFVYTMVFTELKTGAAEPRWGHWGQVPQLFVQRVNVPFFERKAPLFIRAFSDCASHFWGASAAPEPRN